MPTPIPPLHPRPLLTVRRAATAFVTLAALLALVALPAGAGADSGDPPATAPAATDATPELLGGALTVPDGGVVPIGLLVPDDTLDPRLLTLELSGAEWNRAAMRLEQMLARRTTLERRIGATRAGVEATTTELRDVTAELDRARRERRHLAATATNVDALLADRAVHRFVGLGSADPVIDPGPDLDARRQAELLDTVQADLLDRRAELRRRAASIDGEIEALVARRRALATERAAARSRLEELLAERAEVNAALPGLVDAARWTRRRAVVAGTDLPLVALDAYLEAADRQAEAEPTCGLAWWQLAAIARVESRHGRLGPADLGPDGRVSPPIVGIALDGSSGVRRVVDTDGGALDGDPVLDRALGPFQFIPETWTRWAVDGDGDGRLDVQDVDDAAATAARYLCRLGGRLDTTGGWRRAVLGYNASTAYLELVDLYAGRYRRALGSALAA